MSTEDEALWRRVLKLSFITVAYGTAFLALVHLGLLLLQVPNFPPHVVPTDVSSWLLEKWKYKVWWEGSTAALLRDLGLLLLFGTVHSGLSRRAVGATLRQAGVLDRAVYVGASGVSLGALVWWWEPVPILVWRMPWMEGTALYVVHGLAWMMFYGTNLMLDLPDMVGFTQVVLSSPNAVVKSPQMEQMLSTQRHMGLLPFSLILLLHPLMTLDRALMTGVTLVWVKKCWESESGYRYASQMRGRRLYD